MRDSRALLLVILCFALAGAGMVNLAVAQSQNSIAAAASLLALQQPPPADPPPAGGSEVDVDIDADGGVWYTNPVWLVLGAAVVIAVIALLVSGSRSSTTVVK
jgi:hypothetical protein